MKPFKSFAEMLTTHELMFGLAGRTCARTRAGTLTEGEMTHWPGSLRRDAHQVICVINAHPASHC